MKFSHVMIYVNDVARAAKWYGDILGFRAVALYGPHYGILQHDAMDLRLDLHPQKSDAANVGHGAIVYFEVADIDRTLADLSAKGVTCAQVMKEENSPRFSSFKDSEGNDVGLIEAMPQR